VVFIVVLVIVVINNGSPSWVRRKSTHVNITIVSNPSSELAARRRKRVLSKGGGHGNGIKVHNQRNWSANWITVRSRLIYIVSPMVTHGFCVPISLFSYSHVHTIHSHLFLFAGSHQLKILSFTIQPPTPYSPCTGTWYRIPTWHRNWFTTTLLAASALPSTSSSFVAKVAAGWTLWALRLTAAPTANQSAALLAPVIGFPRFPQLFLKSHATLFFPVLIPLSFSFDRVARVLPWGKYALLEEQSASEWETALPLILSPQTHRSRYFVAKNRSRDLRSSIALLS